MRRFRVDRKEDKIVKRRVIKQVEAYKYIPRHAYIFSSFLKKKHGIFCKQLLELQRNVLFFFYIILEGHRMPSLKLHFMKCKCLWTYHLKMLPRKSKT